MEDLGKNLNKDFPVTLIFYDKAEETLKEVKVEEKVWDDAENTLDDDASNFVKMKYISKQSEEVSCYDRTTG